MTFHIVLEGVFLFISSSSLSDLVFPGDIIAVVVARFSHNVPMHLSGREGEDHGMEGKQRKRDWLPFIINLNLNRLALL